MEELMSPIERYKKEYLDDLLKNDKEKHSSIINYVFIENDFIKYIEELGFKKETTACYIKNVGERIQTPDKIYIWLENPIDYKYEFTPHKLFTIKFMEWDEHSLLGWNDRILFSKVPISHKERVKDILQYVEDYYKIIKGI